jgi:proteic killer suppression protein
VPIERQALRKLEQLELSERLEDLRVPPGNRLEALRGKRRGQSSISDKRSVAFVLPLVC